MPMTCKPDLERRSTAGVTANGRKLSGYIARFDSEARIGTFTETIKPGAFRASITSGRDILALADHDESRVLGRTKSGTLELREDGDGLAFVHAGGTVEQRELQAGQTLFVDTGCLVAMTPNVSFRYGSSIGCR